jgi:hypothetical protein
MSENRTLKCNSSSTKKVSQDQSQLSLSYQTSSSSIPFSENQQFLSQFGLMEAYSKNADLGDDSDEVIISSMSKDL